MNNNKKLVQLEGSQSLWEKNKILWDEIHEYKVFQLGALSNQHNVSWNSESYSFSFFKVSKKFGTARVGEKQGDIQTQRKP